jgi:hypothetical protein
MVTTEQWNAAQIAERRFHNEDFETGVEHYRSSYGQYFHYLGIDPDLKGKKVVEIGPADFPALNYCKNIGESFIIEPMPSEHLKRFNIPVVQTLAEDAEYQADEVWLLNVLQHVIDPAKIVEKAMAQANVVRFFEPVEYGVDECHPWNLTLEMFKKWFGDATYYPPNPNAIKFHTWQCAYGVWRKQHA